jgi:hypothetical protein
MADRATQRQAFDEAGASVVGSVFERDEVVDDGYTGDTASEEGRDEVTRGAEIDRVRTGGAREVPGGA